MRQPYRRSYFAAEYRRNRELAIDRAGGRCERCGLPLDDDFSCDHIVALKDGGTNEVANLRILCWPCALVKNRDDKRRRRSRQRRAG